MKAVLAPILALLLAVPAACAPLDLAAAISTQCGPPGYKRDGGCRVRLPRGSLEVRDTIRLGDCTARGTRNSLVIEGESMEGSPPSRASRLQERRSSGRAARGR